MKKIILAMALVVSMSSFSSTIGLSTHPFSTNNRVVTTEFNSYLSNGTGMGITAKYYQRLNRRLNFDAGIGITDGDRSNRLFVGADYEIFPDYGRQPRFSVKGLAETLTFDGDRINTFGVAPTISKGFLFWNKEAFPFVSLPVKVGLNSDEGTYETSTSLATGFTTQLGSGSLRDMIGSVEANFDLKDSYTALVLGVSLPL
ncbi:MAG: hypothetical protein N4A33_07580 [Bacteriovoracaceae bacterium]|jgi:hypothetical protein|nr:hypothetical protein [Bacteriovoracaceae bacterium]